MLVADQHKRFLFIYLPIFIYIYFFYSLFYFILLFYQASFLKGDVENFLKFQGS